MLKSILLPSWVLTIPDDAKVVDSDSLTNPEVAVTLCHVVPELPVPIDIEPKDLTDALVLDDSVPVLYEGDLKSRISGESCVKFPLSSNALPRVNI